MNTDLLGPYNRCSSQGVSKSAESRWLLIAIYLLISQAYIHACIVYTSSIIFSLHVLQACFLEPVLQLSEFATCLNVFVKLV